MADSNRVWTVATAVGIVVASIALASTFVVFPGTYTRHVFIAAGCQVAVTASDQKAFSIVNAEMKRLEAIFSPFGDSALAKVNAAAGKEPVAVPAEFIELIKLSKSAHELTQGAFDASAGTVFWFWKDKIKNGGVQHAPCADDVAAVKDLTGWAHVIVDEQKQTVFIDKPGLKVDLGGIAVGYMVDKTVEKLRAAGIASALIDAGGDIYALGTKAGKPWEVGVKDPDKSDDIIHVYALADEALATSGNYAQCFVFDGKRYSHLVDPVSMLPVQNGLESVTVTAHNTITADIFSTSFFVMGVAKTQAMLYAGNNNMRVLMIERSAKGREMHVLGEQR